MTQRRALEVIGAIALGCFLAVSVVAQEEAAAPKSCPDDVWEEADRFTGGRKVYTAPDAEGTFKVVVAEFLMLEDEKKAKSYALMLQRVSKTWRYLECSSVYALVNGKPLKLAPARHSGSVYDSGSVSEILTIDLTAAQAKAFGTASKIEYKVCNDEFVMPEDRLCAVRSWWVKVAGGSLVYE